MAQHTPGPWKAREPLTDARLLAAAAEMLTELVSAEQTIRNLARGGALEGDYVEIAEQASARMAKLIAKARGE